MIRLFVPRAGLRSLLKISRFKSKSISSLCCAPSARPAHFIFPTTQRTLIQNYSTSIEQAEKPRSKFAFHPEKENDYMCNRFRLWTDYKDTMYDLSKFSDENKWTSYRPIVQEARQLSLNTTDFIPIMDQRAEKLRSLIAKEVNSLPDEDLFALFYAISLLPPTRRLNDPEYKEFWQVLDGECSKRMSAWGYDTLFVVDDLFYRMNIVRATDFHFQLIRKIFRKIEKLSKVHYIRFMYALNITRRAPSFMSNYELECSLQRNIDRLNPEELSIVALSFFKTETKIRDQLLIDKLVEKVIGESKSLHSYFVAGTAKFLRFVSRFELGETVYKFQEAFIAEIARLDPSASLQLALAGTNAFMYHESVVEACKQKIEDNLDRIRIKEIERILLVLSMFKNNCNSFCKKVIEELTSIRRADEIAAFGHCFPSILYYLSLRGHFPHELINTALDTKYLMKHFGRNMAKYQREVLCLDFIVGFECPEYEGNRLEAKIKHKVTKYYMFYFNPWSEEKVTGHGANLKDMVDICTKILGGRDFVFVCNILPQYQTSELIFCLDENKQPVGISKSLRDISEYDPKWIPKDDEARQAITYHAITLCNRNSCFNNSDKLLGQQEKHFNLLERMGYILHPIFPLEWQSCERNEEKERAVLMNRIFNQVLSPEKLKAVLV